MIMYITAIVFPAGSNNRDENCGTLSQKEFRPVQSSYKAFTLIEPLAVIAIIGHIAAGAGQGKRSGAKMQVGQQASLESGGQC